MLRLNFGGQLPERTVCLYGLWTRYLEGDTWRPIPSALDACWGRLEVVHTTGHLLEEDIKWLVRTVRAMKVVPIYTIEPEAFKPLGR